jgi:hypothetical protein
MARRLRAWDNSCLYVHVSGQLAVTRNIYGIEDRICLWIPGRSFIKPWAVWRVPGTFVGPVTAVDVGSGRGFQRMILMPASQALYLFSLHGVCRGGFVMNGAGNSSYSCSEGNLLISHGPGHATVHALQSATRACVFFLKSGLYNSR